MDAHNTERIAALEATSWWYTARRRMVVDLLQRHGPFARGLDFGCGVGANLETLASACDHGVGFDPSIAAARYAASREVSPVLLGDGTALPFASGRFDLVLCLDVLEHVDDRAALGEIERVLSDGGLMILSVPAHPHLWNENDDFSHHLRRYRRPQLARRLDRFDILELGYWNFASYLPALLYVLWRRLVPVPPRNNLDAVPSLAERPLGLAVGLENRLRRWLPMPTGTSLVAVVRKTPRQARQGAHHG